MEQMKKCKYCQSEIDKKAKVCPNCRKKQKGKTLPIIIGVIVLFIIIGALNSKDDEPKSVNNGVQNDSDGTGNKESNDSTKGTDNKETDTKEKVDEEKTSFAVGETASLKDVLVTLNGITISEGSQFNTPSDGKIFLLCEFTIENDSKKDIAVSSIMSFEAYCDDFSINQSISGLLEKDDKNQLDGSVAAGKKMNGVIAYEVPTDWKELEIQFSPSFWGKSMTFTATNE